MLTQATIRTILAGALLAAALGVGAGVAWTPPHTTVSAAEGPRIDTAEAALPVAPPPATPARRPR